MPGRLNVWVTVTPVAVFDSDAGSPKSHVALTTGDDVGFDTLNDPDPPATNGLGDSLMVGSGEAWTKDVAVTARPRAPPGTETVPVGVPSGLNASISLTVQQ